MIDLAVLAGACEHQLAVARREWPNGIPLTEEAALRCAALGLDVDWAAKRLLTTAKWVEYERLKAAAWAEYKRFNEAEWAEYRRLRAAELLKLLTKKEGAK